MLKSYFFLGQLRKDVKKQAGASEEIVGSSAPPVNANESMIDFSSGIITDHLTLTSHHLVLPWRNRAKEV